MRDAICELGVKQLIFPYLVTFSYGNREDFDVKNTKCKMGMLNEYVRKMPESVRSKGPVEVRLCYWRKTKNSRKLVEINHLVREVFLTCFSSHEKCKNYVLWGTASTVSYTDAPCRREIACSISDMTSEV
ncbi:MAG: AAC(3) family N-acetyltransferase [Clostridium sp.]